MQRQLAHFRRIACLGLPPQAAVVALLDALHTRVPSSFDHFGFADEDLRITNGRCEDPACYRFVTPYFSEFDGKMNYWPAVQDCLRRGPGVGYYLPYQTPQFYHSAYCNEIERPLGSYHHQQGHDARRRHRRTADLRSRTPQRGPSHTARP